MAVFSELRSLRDADPLGRRCGDCEYRELCGGCRCRAYARRHRLRRITEEVMDAAIQGSGRSF